MKLKKTTKILLLSATLPCVAALTPVFCLTGCNKKVPDKLEHLMRAEISGDTDLAIKYDVSKKMLTDLSISTDGQNWTKITEPTTLHFKKDDKVYFAGNNPKGLAPVDDYLNIKFTNADDQEPTVKLCGSVMSLLGDYEGKMTGLPNTNTFQHLFEGSTAIKEIDKGFLPATQISISCYTFMFAGCTKLKSIPVGLLPAQELSQFCYYGMFFSCHSLEKLEKGLLPSTDLAPSCYYAMFEDCRNLKTIEAGLLPATKLAAGCYRAMFRSDNITIIPKNLLPATELAELCYAAMFEGNKSLWVVPNDLLPCTTLAPFCYQDMFSTCISLKNLVDLPATDLPDSCYNRMYYGCEGLTEIPESFVFNATTMDRWSCALLFASCTNISKINPNLLKNVKQLNFASMDGMFCDTAIDTPVPLPDDVELAEACFQELYRNVKLKTLPKLAFKDGLQAYCFRAMFRECDLRQVNPDEFKALNSYDTLKLGCFESMFQDARLPDAVCENMSTYFNLKAKDSLPWVYKNMFNGSNIKSLPIIGLENLDDESLLGMFASTKIETIPDSFTLPGKFNEFAKASCRGMFFNCSNLKTINENLFPQLTKIPDYGFSEMFAKCTYLTNVCNIKAKTFGEDSCENMFRETGIEKLDKCIFDQTATLNLACFDSMFAQCKALKTVCIDFLPFTTLDTACYFKMFTECTVLTTVPELPATTLSTSCYESMFEGCSSLDVTTESTSATKIFTVPADSEDCVLLMFNNTANPELSTPESGKTYYFKINP